MDQAATALYSNTSGQRIDGIIYISSVMMHSNGSVVLVAFVGPFCTLLAGSALLGIAGLTLVLTRRNGFHQ